MGRYHQLTQSERVFIQIGLSQGQGFSEIARKLGRYRSTIAREVLRNQSKKVKGSEKRGYCFLTAQNLFRKRRRKSKRRKIDKFSYLKKYVREGLEKSWSPEQISGRMSLEQRPFFICTESIYAYIYDKGKRSPVDWLKLFQKNKKKKKFFRRKSRPRKRVIPLEKLITQRGEEVSKRKEIGHWEGDLVNFKKSLSVSNITTLVERKMRYLVMIKNKTRQTCEVMGKIQKGLCRFPRKLSKTLSLDQGPEFMFWRLLERLDYRQKIKVYYCHPRSPWEKGTNENTNGRIRAFLPRSSNIDKMKQEELDKIGQTLNNTPRKVLGFRTPNELFLKEF